MRHQSDDVRAITSQMAPIFIVYCLQTSALPAPIKGTEL